MTPDGARRVAVGGVLCAGVLAATNDIAAGRAPQVRIALGVVVAGVLLTSLAGPAPDLAGGLGALIAVAAVLSTGAAAFTTIKKGLS